MLTYLITDLHFGVRHNSIPFWNYQKDFFTKQLIPDLKAHPGSRLICLGDVFDSRSTISTYILTEAQQLLIDTAKCVSEFIIVAGNHDFYSPVEDTYCVLEPLLGHVPDIRLVVREIYTCGRDVFIPWYCMEKIGPSETSKQYAGRRIFTHTDAVTNPQELFTHLYTGHIHTPYNSGLLHNLGSTYPLTMIDANQERYYYVLNGDNTSPVAIPNKHSLRFWKIDSADTLSRCAPDDYIELMLPAAAVSRESDKIKNMRNTYKNIRIVFKPEICESIEIAPEYNLEDFIRASVPKDLIDKFETIHEKIQKTK